MNTIKKFKFLLILIFFLSSNSEAFSPYNEKECIGYYRNSKIYLGQEKAKKYYSCTIKQLSEKFSNEEKDIIFKRKPEEIMKATEFASNYCEKNF